MRMQYLQTWHQRRSLFLCVARHVIKLGNMNESVNPTAAGPICTPSLALAPLCTPSLALAPLHPQSRARPALHPQSRARPAAPPVSRSPRYTPSLILSHPLSWLYLVLYPGSFVRDARLTPPPLPCLHALPGVISLYLVSSVALVFCLSLGHALGAPPVL